MARTICISGVSSGIGLACAQLFLAQGETVVGIGRKCNITADNFTFLQLDLSNLDEVQKFNFPQFKTSELILINNAGIVGEIAPFWEQSAFNLINVYNINILAVALLSRSFIQSFQKGIIINISSGAANRPIKGWSVYCSTKASLDMFSLALEQEIRFFQKEFIIKSIAPGVVDTNMQSIIRETPVDLFPDSESFHALHIEGKLEKTEVVAKKLDYVIRHIDSFPETIFSLRDVHL